jgi:hypothetical protein
MTYSCIKKEKMEWEFKPRTSQIEEFWTVNRGVWVIWFFHTNFKWFIHHVNRSLCCETSLRPIRCFFSFCSTHFLNWGRKTIINPPLLQRAEILWHLIIVINPPSSKFFWIKKKNYRFLEKYIRLTILVAFMK